MENLIIYKEILEAIKFSKTNLDLEYDMNDENIDKDYIVNKLIEDIEIQKLAKEKVLKNNEYRRK